MPKGMYGRSVQTMRAVVLKSSGMVLGVGRTEKSALRDAARSLENAGVDPGTVRDATVIAFDPSEEETRVVGGIVQLASRRRR